MTQTKMAKDSRPAPETKLYELTVEFFADQGGGPAPIKFRYRTYANEAGENKALSIVNGGYNHKREDGTRVYYPARAIHCVSVREVEADTAV